MLIVSQVLVDYTLNGRESVPSSRVEQVIVRNHKDLGELFVIVGHHDRLGRTLRGGQQGVNVFNSHNSSSAAAFN